MRYLYGDSTPFPLNSNFLETARAVTEAAVAFLALEARMVEARQTQQASKERATREMLEVEQVERVMQQAFVQAAQVGGRGQLLADEAHRLVEQRIAATRQHIGDQSNSVIIEAAKHLETNQVRAPLEAFWCAHELPYTRWGLFWNALDGGVGGMHLTATTPKGFLGKLSVDIPEKHHWEQSFRVSHFAKELVVKLMGTGWLGGAKLKNQSLHKYYVVGVTRSDAEESLRLRKHPRDPGDGLLIKFREGDDAVVRVARVNASGQRTGDTETVNEDEAALLGDLWREVIADLLSLLDHRSKLLFASLEDCEVEKLETPALLAELFIDASAPFVSELAHRSASTRELQLKRETGDGRREELFVPRNDFLERIGQLSLHDQTRFSAFGLSGPMSTAAPPPVVSSAPPAPAPVVSSAPPEPPAPPTPLVPPTPPEPPPPLPLTPAPLHTPTAPSAVSTPPGHALSPDSQHYAQAPSPPGGDSAAPAAADGYVDDGPPSVDDYEATALIHQPVFGDTPVSGRLWPDPAGDRESSRLPPDLDGDFKGEFDDDDSSPFGAGIPESSVFPPPQRSDSPHPTFVSALPSGLASAGAAKVAPPPLPTASETSVEVPLEFEEEGAAPTFDGGETMERDPWSNASGANGEAEPEPISSPSVAEVLARAAHELDMEDELVPMLSNADETAEYNFHDMARAVDASDTPAPASSDAVLMSAPAVPVAPPSESQLSQRMPPPPNSTGRRPPPPPPPPTRRKPGVPPPPPKRSN